MFFGRLDGCKRAQRARSNRITGRTPRLEHLESRTLLSSIHGSGLDDLQHPYHCGCRGCCQPHDHLVTGGAAVAEEYNFSGYRWDQPGGTGSTITLTYSFHSSFLNGNIQGMDAATAKTVIETALRLWSTYAPLQFVEKADTGPDPTIEQEYSWTDGPTMRFGARSFGDGSYGVLAHAYYPANFSGLAGDLIFDSDTDWSTHPASGMDLLEVAVHEIGHTLGLGHENSAQSIMQPVYGRYYSGLGTQFLFQDDINGIQSIYGAGSGSVQPLGSGGDIIEDDPDDEQDSVPDPDNDIPPDNSSGGSGYFDQQGNVLYVNGTEQADRFSFEVGSSTHTVTLNGESFTVDPGAITSVVFRGKGGSDSAVIKGDSGDEAFVFQPGSLTATGSRYSLDISEVESIEVHAGAGHDTATFNDSAGNDLFLATEHHGYLWGDDSFNMVYDVEYLTAISTGGHDTAALYDSAENDVFHADATEVSMTLAAGKVFLASGFDQVYGVSTSGTDQANFLDASGNNVYHAGDDKVYQRGDNFNNAGYGFANVTGTQLPEPNSDATRVIADVDPGDNPKGRRGPLPPLGERPQAGDVSTDQPQAVDQTADATVDAALVDPTPETSTAPPRMELYGFDIVSALGQEEDDPWSDKVFEDVELWL